MSTRKPRRYPLHQSPLFRVLGQSHLARALCMDWPQICALASAGIYRVWTNPSGREIQEPVAELKRLHLRIGDLLAKIELPEYVYSQKGRSYVDNARQHLGHTPLFKTDIQKFYPSTTRKMVFAMFRDDFECAEDVASVLADLCCYEQKHLPTGSSISGRIAFLASKRMFNAIATLAKGKGCKLSVYVDDITVSGQGATRTLMSEVRGIIRQHGFKTREAKSKSFPASSAKPVTGVVISGNELALPNLRHRKIWDAKKAVRAAQGADRKAAARKLQGRIEEAKQILGPLQRYPLACPQILEIEAGLLEADAGKFASNDEVNAVFAKYGA